MKYYAQFRGGVVIYEVKDDVVTIDTRDSVIDAGYYVMADIAPYKSQVNGKIITSRSQHREHLKASGCIEVGNDIKYLSNKKPEPDNLKRTIIDIANSKGMT